MRNRERPPIPSVRRVPANSITQKDNREPGEEWGYHPIPARPATTSNSKSHTTGIYIIVFFLVFATTLTALLLYWPR
ncbi:MAG: hypothetical protein IAF02_14670 [Anaerolineae bacterium]|nr:hypothetical protein [Anaerolineae bacterium]